MAINSPAIIAAAPIVALLEQLTTTVAATPVWEQGSGSHRAASHLASALKTAIEEAARQPLLLGTRTVADLVGRTPEDVAYHCRSGHFPHATKIGAEWFVPLDDLRGPRAPGRRGGSAHPPSPARSRSCRGERRHG